MFIHNVLFARTSPDEVEERGLITRDQAIALFRTFPFQIELEARERDPNLMVPTITLKDQSSNRALVIWSEMVGKFVIWFTPACVLAEDISDPDAVDRCIGLFLMEATMKLCSSSQATNDPGSDESNALQCRERERSPCNLFMR
jgi:hypothetical protein